MHFCFLLLLLQSTPAQEHAAKGYQFLQAGDLKSAEAELRQATALSPRDAVSLALLGMVHAQQGKVEEANADFRKALVIDPEDAGTRYNLAAGEFRLGKAPAAKAELERILKSKPGHPAATLLLGMVLESLHDYQAASRRFEAVPDLVRRRADTIQALVRCYYQTGRRDRARATLEWLRNSGPESVLSGAELAASFRDFDTAEALLMSVTATHPNPAQVAYEMALVQYNAGRFAESAGTLQRLAGAGSRDPKIFNLLSWAYHRQNRPADALSAMHRAIELDPAAEINYDHLAQILVEEKNYFGASQAVAKALALAPNSAAAYKMKGQVERGQGLLKQALGSYARAAELDVGDAEAMLLLGAMQKTLNQPASAAATFEQGIARFPKDPLFYEAYGRMLIETGPAAKSRAVPLLEKALALDGRLPGAQYALGKVLLDTGKPEESLPHLEAAAKLRPRSRRIHLALATAYKTLDRGDDYRRELQIVKTLLGGEEDEQ